MESTTVNDPMLNGLDAELSATLQKELQHLEIPVQQTNAAGTGDAPKAGETATANPELKDTTTQGPGATTQPPPPPGAPEAAPAGADDPAKRKRNAVRYAKMNDLTVSSLLAFVKKLPREKFAADNDELASLVDAWEDFLMENTDFKVPGYVQLLIANVVIFGIKGFGQDLMNFAGFNKAEEAPQQEPQQRPQPQPVNEAPPPPRQPEPQVTIHRTPDTQPQRQPNAEVVKYVEVKSGPHKCQLPGCNVMLKGKKKFCGHKHSTMWNNYKLRGIAIDADKI
jgi:hypothetical protein